MEEVNISEQKEQICGICSKTAQLKCSACKAIFYCNRDHQRLHWKEHAKDCVPFKMSKDSILGRHYIATRKIEIDDIVIKEMKPLVSAPLLNTCPLCLNCYSILSNFNAKPCEKCGWPLCNECNAHGNECEFTIKHRETKIVINDFGVPHPTYKCIGVIRALALQEIDPENYKRFINLQSHLADEENDDENDDRNDNENDDKNDNENDDEKKSLTIREKEFLEIAQFVKEFFKLDDVKLEEIVKILGIFQINGHEVPTTENPHAAVYDVASYFEHNCRANCSKSFTENDGIVIRAVTTILKGEHLTLCYTDPLWGVTNRRHHLLHTKFFNCMCDRCRDPTECRMMFNSFKCRNKKCFGSSYPSSFISETFPDYVCERCHETTISWKDAELILESIGIELTTMMKDDIESCREFIKRNSKIIDGNHYYMTDVKLALAHLIGQQDGGLTKVSDRILCEKLVICKDLERLLHILVPAENRIRGLVSFELHAGLAEYGRRQGKEQMLEILTMSHTALTEAHQLLRHESEILPEGKIAKIAEQNIYELDKIIRRLSNSKK